MADEMSANFDPAIVRDEEAAADAPMPAVNQIRLASLEREVSKLREANQALARYIRACAGRRDTTPEIERLISTLEGRH